MNRRKFDVVQPHDIRRGGVDIKTIVIADDLTGANATGVLLRKNGFRVLVRLDAKSRTDEFEDATVYSTNSRNSSGEVAFSKIDSVCESIDFSRYDIVAKRIDSTLRGNIRIEIGAMQKKLKERLFLIVPAFPRAGRYCEAGTLMVSGKKLEETEAARDPLFPVKSSKVCDILGMDPSDHIPLSAVESGADALLSILKKRYAGGTRLLIADGKTDEHIQAIARAVTESGIPFVSVDPGPLTAAVALYGEKRKRRKLFFAIGTGAQNTREQIDLLKRQYSPESAVLSLRALLLSPAKEEKRALSLLMDTDNDLLLLYTDSLSMESPANDSERTLLAKRIEDAIASITRQLLRHRGDIDTILCCGGDITSSVCRKLRVSGIELMEEVAPLLSYGKLQGTDLRIITKGGLAGERDALCRCVSFWKEGLHS